jgi:hypothetical protein
MANKTFTTTTDAQWDADEVRGYLEGHGYRVDGLSVGLGTNGDGDPTVTVTVDLDPHVPDAALTADLGAFAPTANPQATAQVQLRVALAALRGATDQATTEERLDMHEAVILAYAATLGV